MDSQPGEHKRASREKKESEEQDNLVGWGKQDPHANQIGEKEIRSKEKSLGGGRLGGETATILVSFKPDSGGGLLGSPWLKF